MAATTVQRNTEFAGLIPARGTYPMAADTLLLRGTMVALDANGRAVAGGTAGRPVVGKASHTVNNLTGSENGGAADAVDIEVEFGVFGFVGEDTPAVGDIVYAVDNQTVSPDDETTGGVAGVVTEVRNGQTYVFMGPHVSGPYTQLLAGIAAAMLAPAP